MRIGVLLPHRGVILQSARRPPVEDCWAIARLADAADMDVWVGDSVVAKPRLEPLTTLAYVAAITKRSKLGTAILLPALRQPTVLAHQLANIDQISQGRLVLGLGVGWGLPAIVREWEACGKSHKRRVKDLEEHITVWRKLWSGEPVTAEGIDYKLTEHTIGPLPWNKEGPPLLVTAGNRGEIIHHLRERGRHPQAARGMRRSDGAAWAATTGFPVVCLHDGVHRKRFGQGRKQDARFPRKVLRRRREFPWHDGPGTSPCGGGGDPALPRCRCQ
jgi:hypothetical protein